MEGEYQRGQDRGMRGEEDKVSKERRARTTNLRTLDVICCSLHVRPITKCIKIHYCYQWTSESWALASKLKLWLLDSDAV